MILELRLQKYGVNIYQKKKMKKKLKKKNMMNILPICFPEIFNKYYIYLIFEIVVIIKI